MNPVTGPDIVVKSSGTSPYYWYQKQHIRKQVKPYNLDLPYQGIYWFSTPGFGTRYSAGSYGGNVNSPLTFDATGDSYFNVYKIMENQAITKAITKFNTFQASRAALGVAMAQSKQSVNMITTRLGQVYSCFKSLKRFDVKGAAAALGLTVGQAKRRHRAWVRAGKRGPYSLRDEDIWDPAVWDRHKGQRRRASAVSDLWLEFSFGWMPLIGDVHTAMEVLSDNPFYTSPIKAGGSHSYDYTSSTVTDTGTWLYSYVGKHKVKFSVSVGGVLTVTNANSNLLSRLGIVNLAQVAYELVTFSFVLNYFVNIEEYINQFSQYDGVQVSQAWYTVKWNDTLAYEHKNTYKPTQKVDLIRSYGAQAISFTRVVGSLPAISLRPRPSYYNGMKRGINNAALLVQLLRNPR